ncbi:type II toxin-antitoxin system Phd/YefM family antitoxin [Nocardia carnea]|uniref:Type II toxin-antitoxin system Phd/YefM family antitoxin n=1 Tax=Nocardia carnea TaxID=37328 RepID=A0ABW7TUL3_9NOCA|nr:type II toxin-antitoxin system prevent-host-death family antitoxin [Nocardia carnea]
MRRIRQRELRHGSDEILAAVERGESFVITQKGNPVAELTPVTRRRFVPVAELARTSAHLPRIDYAEGRATADSLIDQEVTGGDATDQPW